MSLAFREYCSPDSSVPSRGRRFPQACQLAAWPGADSTGRFRQHALPRPKPQTLFLKPLGPPRPKPAALTPKPSVPQCSPGCRCEMVEALMQPNVANLPNEVQQTYVQALMKVFARAGTAPGGRACEEASAQDDQDAETESQPLEAQAGAEPTAVSGAYSFATTPLLTHCRGKFPGCVKEHLCVQERCGSSLVGAPASRARPHLRVNFEVSLGMYWVADDLLSVHGVPHFGHQSCLGAHDA